MPVAPDDLLARVAIKDREHLIRFLQGSHRQFWVMDAADLVRSLPEPFSENMDLLQQIVACYRDHRRGQSSGFTEIISVVEPLSDRRTSVRAPIMKGETLEPEELDALIQWAQEERAQALARRAAKVDVREVL